MSPSGLSQAPSGYWIPAPKSGAKTKEAIVPLVQVKVIKGVFDSSQKQDMISQHTETMVRIEGEALRGVTWVTIDEVESGDWGIGGNAITAQYVKDLQRTPAASR
jgi:4-oxalocrotonate tautomerase